MEMPALGMDAHYKSTYPLSFQDTNSLPAQINTHFLKTLQRRVHLDYSNTSFSDYVAIFHESEFKSFFDQKASILAEATYTIHAKQMPTEKLDIDILLNSNFDRLLHQFLSQYCQQLTGDSLPATTTLYDNSTVAHDQQTALDFLHLDDQRKKFYIDLETMSPMNLQNARDSFLFAQADETIHLIFDQTIYGSCREGFALTDKGLYWKSHFKQPQQVYFDDLKILEKMGSGLNVNNLFFDVNTGVNERVFLFLQRKMGG